jgi:prevent-host-death family protein
VRRLVVDIHEAKATFSKLVSAAEGGSEVVVEKHGKPVAKLIAYTPAPTPRKPGMFAGQIEIKPSFDELPEEFEEVFE